MLFAERQGIVILSCDPGQIEDILTISRKHKMDAEHIGTVGGNRLIIGDLVDEPVEELLSIYSNALPAALGVVVAEL